MGSKQEKNQIWNACWWNLGDFSLLVWQDIVKRGENCASIKWGKRGTLKPGLMESFCSHWAGSACGWCLLYPVQLPSQFYYVYLKYITEILFFLLQKLISPPFKTSSDVRTWDMQGVQHGREAGLEMLNPFLLVQYKYIKIEFLMWKDKAFDFQKQPIEAC